MVRKRQRERERKRERERESGKSVLSTRLDDDDGDYNGDEILIFKKIGFFFN